MRKFSIFLSLLLAVTFTVVVLSADGFQRDNDIHTPDYYDHTVRKAFKRGDWNGGKRLLDEGLERYPEVSGLTSLQARSIYTANSLTMHAIILCALCATTTRTCLPSRCLLMWKRRQRITPAPFATSTSCFRLIPIGRDCGVER